MSKIQIVLKPASHGDYFIFHIPNKLIKNDLIDPDQTYLITLEPIKKQAKTKN
ncbi:MAG: hypothetical protein ACFFAS_20445 [Promethearchaeota archaeon]